MGFVLKVKTKNGQHVITNLTATDTLDTLIAKLAEVTKIGRPRLSVLIGFPPKRLNITQDGTKTLEASSVTNGDTLIVDEKPAEPLETEINNMDKIIAEQMHQEFDDNHPNSEGILLKKVVPSDNSCLFTSFGFLLNNIVDPGVAKDLRVMIARQVEKDPEEFNEGVLGKSNKDYCDWIQKPESWGGAIEIAILSRFYGFEIGVVDISNGIINYFGEDQNFGLRAFLLFDGIHYDPLYLEHTSDGKMKTMFRREDEEVMRQAKQLALEAKSSRQFTDVDKFTLKCNQCQMSLTGQVQAQQHAKSTGHVDFGEV